MDSNKDDILQENEERIFRYLHGDMTSEEEAQFEMDLQSDETLRSQTETIARTIKAMGTIGSEQDRKFVSEMKKTSNKKARPMRWLSIAASVAIIFTFGFKLFDYIRIGNIGEEYATLFPASEIFNGDENFVIVSGWDCDYTSTQLTVLFNNVAEGKDLDNTITILSPLWTNYYKGVDLTDRESINNNIREGFVPYEHYIGWYLIIAYLRNHDKKNARNVLGQMRRIYLEETSIMGSSLFELSLKIRYLM